VGSRFEPRLASLFIVLSATVVGCGSAVASIPSSAPPSVVALPSPTPTPTEVPTAAPSPTPVGYFVDPAGGYALSVGPDWVHEASGAVSKGIEFWVVATPENGFAPNVNILAQTTGGLDLAGYAAASLRIGPKLMVAFKLVSSKIIVGPTGPMLRFEYLGTYNGAALHFLSFAVISDDTAYLATFTAPLARYKSLVSAVEPFLRTLTALPGSAASPTSSP